MRKSYGNATDATQWNGAPTDNFLVALKSKGGAKIRNCQCEISHKICSPACQQIQSGSNSGISIAIQ